MNNITLVHKFIKTLEMNSKHIILGEKTNLRWNKIDREELYSMIKTGVRILKDRGVKKGDRIGFKGNNSIEWVAWNMSCYAVGAVWVPMYNNQNKDYCNYILNDCQPKLLICDDSNIEHKNTIPIKLEPCMNDFGSPELIKNELATLIYSSGTTGNPKGVMLSHNNIISNIENIHNRFSDAKTTTSLNVLPWAHIYSLTCELYYNLTYDNTTYISSGKDAFINECREVNPTVIYIVPKVLDVLKNKLDFLDKPVINILLPQIINFIFGGRLETVYMGGAKLHDNTKHFFIDNGMNICEGYGSTETSPIVSVNHQITPRNPDSVGKILRDVNVKIIDGEIHVTGNNVMTGYWNNKDATDKALIVHEGQTWYKTGDSGVVVDDFLFYKGRISENYKLNNGKFVDVTAVENVVKKYLKHNAIVFGENESHNSIISDGEVSSEILEKINSNLEPFLRIKEKIIITPEEMQTYLTPKMSIKRKKLIEYVNRIIK